MHLSELDLWQDKKCTLLRAARLEKMKNSIDEVSEEVEADNLLEFLKAGKTYAILDVEDKAYQLKIAGIFSHVLNKEIEREHLVSWAWQQKLVAVFMTNLLY